MQDQLIAFIGGGNMARSLVSGLVASGYDAGNIRVADPDPGQREIIRRTTGAVTEADNDAAAADAAVVVLAVKPQVLRTVVTGLAGTLGRCRPLVVSIAAGVREQDIRRWIGDEPAVVRAMPNTPALLGCGATALYANAWTSEAQRGLAESLLRSVGAAVWLEDEALMDVVTAASGSGPAYFFLLMEAMEQTACRMGLAPDQARLLIQETAVGAARMALESSEDVATLRRRVTSPGGTTEAAVAVLEQAGLRSAVSDAMDRARERSVEMAREFGADDKAKEV